MRTLTEDQNVSEDTLQALANEANRAKAPPDYKEPRVQKTKTKDFFGKRVGNTCARKHERWTTQKRNFTASEKVQRASYSVVQWTEKKEEATIGHEQLPYL